MRLRSEVALLSGLDTRGPRTRQCMRGGMQGIKLYGESGSGVEGRHRVENVCDYLTMARACLYAYRAVDVTCAPYGKSISGTVVLNVEKWSPLSPYLGP